MFNLFSKNDIWRVVGIILIILGGLEIDILPFRDWEIPVIGKIQSNGLDLIGWVLVVWPFLGKYLRYAKTKKNIDRESGE